MMPPLSPAWKVACSCSLSHRLQLLLLSGFPASMALWLAMGLVSSPLHADDAAGKPPVAVWNFDNPDRPTAANEKLVGKAEVLDQGPAAPEFPDFAESNHALRLTGGASLRVPDTDSGSLDFDNGDEITLEAWVGLDSLRENAYVIGKGRTQNPGVAPNNQNWALRLRSQHGLACVNFLFRSRPEGAGQGSGDAVVPKADKDQGQWHRWTSKQGFAAGSGWHHIAVSYRFGDPQSIRGYLDGAEVKGAWDMDGATTRPPVVDDDEVWIGSSMAGQPSNSLHGLVDQVAVHRQVLPAEVLQSRFRYEPIPIGAPEVPPGKVVVQLFGPIAGTNAIPRRTGSLRTQWLQDQMAFVRLPHKYDDWGIREDWGSTLLVRATTNVTLPAGEHQLLIRSRGLSRLWIDDAIVATTPAQKNRGSAHHVVDPLPEVPFPGMRPHAMNDREQMATFEFDGQSHRVVFEVIVGGPSYRPEFGETCVAVAGPNDAMFTLLAAERDFPLTDDGWQAFVQRQADELDQLDTVTRRAAAQTSIDYWQQRHQYAQSKWLGDRSIAADKPARAIDQQIAARLTTQATAVAGGTTDRKGAEAARFYHEQVQPIFAQHCFRCHGEKEQGGLSLQSRENLLAGGESETPAVVPGRPEESQLYELVSAAKDDYRMPPKGEGLTVEEQQTIAKWITRGAEMPAEDALPSVQPTATSDDYTFLRRAYIDTVGVSPTLEETQRFLADDREQRRTRLIDRLLDDPRVADNWVGYWQDALAENPNLLKPMLNNTGPFRWWIYEALLDNKPLDRFATELIMMRGSQWDGGTAGFGIASQNDSPMAAKAFVIGSAFLGVQMKCARCHDAPYHQWKQGDLFQMAAMLERKPIKLPASSTVPAAFFENQARKSLIEVTINPGQTIEPHWPFEAMAPAVPGELLNDVQDPREQLAARVTLSRRFAEMMANRLWGRLMGLALVEPVDDWEGNAPSDPALLALLTDQLIAIDYDWRQLCRNIMNSQAYQRVAVDRELGADPRRRVYHGPYRRRMSAEQVVDTALHAVGQTMDTEPLTLDVEGTLPPKNFLNFGKPQRAWEFTTLANERDRPSLALPRAQAIADVMKAFGWRNSRPEPIAERERAANLIQPAVLANGTFGTWLTRLSDDSGLTRLALKDQPVEAFVDRLFLSILTRPPSPEERASFVALLQPGFENRHVPLSDVADAPEQKRFRYVSWSNHLNTEANKIKVEMQAVARQGPPPTRYLRDDWRSRAEDAIWSLLNSPEMVLIP